MARTPGGRILTCLRTLEGCLFFSSAPLIHAKDRGRWRTVGRVKLVNIAPREVVCARAPLYCVRILTKVLIEGVSCLFLCCRLPPGLFGKHGVQCAVLVPVPVAVALGVWYTAAGHIVVTARLLRLHILVTRYIVRDGSRGEWYYGVTFARHVFFTHPFFACRPGVFTSPRTAVVRLGHLDK